MSQRFVALDDVLRALEESGPLSSGALARRLRLNRLDARLVLVDAHAHSLVRATGRGDWAITDRGREALTTDLEESRQPAATEPDRWSPGSCLERLRAFGGGSRWRQVLHPRHLARRGLPLALGTITCAGGVAVASSRLGSSAPAPVIATTHIKARAHGGHTQAPITRHLVATGVIATHRHRGSALVSTTGRIRHVRGHVLVQAARPTTPQCAQRSGAHTAGAHVTGVCTSGRRTHLHSTTGGVGVGSGQRPPQNTGSGGSDGGLRAGGSTGS